MAKSKKTSNKDPFPPTSEGWRDYLPSWLGGDKVKSAPGATYEMMYGKTNQPESRRLQAQNTRARNIVVARREAEKETKKRNRRQFNK